MPLSPASLRIALVSLHTSPGAEPGSGDAGGMNVVVRHQAEALGALGHTVEVLTRRVNPAGPDSEPLAPGVTLRFLTAGPAASIAKGQHENYIEEFRMRLAELGPYDIIHSHHWFSGMAALPLARERGIPHVQSFHSIAADPSTPLSEGERPESRGRLAGEAWLARESDRVVAISNAEADTVLHRLGGRADRISVVFPGVDGVLFHPVTAARSTADSPADSPADRPADPPADSTTDPGYAIVAARLQPLKGLDLAIEAIAEVPAEIRPRLVISGDASADFAGYIDELHALAARRGIEGGIRFVGPQSREHLATLLREARLVLVPSHSETYGLVALEAAASGVPVIASASGGLREAVVDGVTGLVLDSRDPAIWGSAISEIVTDAALAHRLGGAARVRAEHLDWPLSAAALLAVYRSLVTSDVGNA
ncbi:glycosyltransferase [Glaciibacter psychrotolerans]|uniref:D-inositol-3-phosphate glycosyltransferase n=1 Tax=Glaciibacter psychrotolerans TaxID=670054 RepID=A0A7Z0EEE3_9MICO|nr:D-inositol-3-phosphate glycosyltransferase [Leifsonia psychrotolerans]